MTNPYDMIERLVAMQTVPMTPAEYRASQETIKDAVKAIGELIDRVDRLRAELRQTNEAVQELAAINHEAGGRITDLEQALSSERTLLKLALIDLARLRAANAELVAMLDTAAQFIDGAAWSGQTFEDCETMTLKIEQAIARAKGEAK